MAFSRFTSLPLITLALLSLSGGVAPSEAASITDAYLFSIWSTPPNDTAPPFTITSIDGVELFLNAEKKASGFSDIGSGLSFLFQEPLTYSSHTRTLNPGEGFSQDGAVMGPRVNSEIGTIDDAGLVVEGAPDAPKNVDFTHRAKLVLKIPTGGLGTDRLLIVEDAGLDPFKLEHRATGSDPWTLLFKGFTWVTRNDLLDDRLDFGANDVDNGHNDIDQAWIFLFNEPLQGFFRISEYGSICCTKLEIDFAGVTRVAEPATLALLGSGLLGLALAVGLRRKRRCSYFFGCSTVSTLTSK